MGRSVGLPTRPFPLPPMRSGTLLFLILVVVACDTTIPAPATTFWEGDLLPMAATMNGMNGQVAAISRRVGTDIGIRVAGIERGAAHPWRLRDGTCANPGSVLGPPDSYPNLVQPGGAEVEAEAYVPPRLDADGQYFVEVHASTSDPTPVLCGDLTPI